MAHEKKAALPCYVVLTTDGDANTTFHGATNDVEQARALQGENPGSVVVKPHEHKLPKVKTPKTSK